MCGYHKLLVILNCFLYEFKQRVIDIEKQKWYSSVSDNKKLYVYSLLKTDLEIYGLCTHT